MLYTICSHLGGETFPQFLRKSFAIIFINQDFVTRERCECTLTTVVHLNANCAIGESQRELQLTIITQQ